MDAIARPEAALEAVAAHFAGMPPVAALQPEILEWRHGLLRLRAPLAANVNDKACAFGGSLVSLMTIAAWGLVSLELETAGLHAEVFVADSRVRYLKPVFEDIVVEAAFDDPGEHAALADTLRRQGRAGIRLQARTLLADGGVAATFVGRYVAIGKD
ncbi:YiiD C-terminal domain-containing protein [Thermomonas brevis]